MSNEAINGGIFFCRPYKLSCMLHNALSFANVGNKSQYTTRCYKETEVKHYLVHTFVSVWRQQHFCRLQERRIHDWVKRGSRIFWWVLLWSRDNACVITDPYHAQCLPVDCCLPRRYIGVNQHRTINPFVIFWLKYLTLWWCLLLDSVRWCKLIGHGTIHGTVVRGSRIRASSSDDLRSWNPFCRHMASMFLVYTVY
jgi:hypothetical protein